MGLVSLRCPEGPLCADSECTEQKKWRTASGVLTDQKTDKLAAFMNEGWRIRGRDSNLLRK